MKKPAFTLSLASALLGPNVLAHDGHGLGGAHWHATDTIGFVVAAALVVVAVYFSKK
jgi:hypothetical protein